MPNRMLRLQLFRARFSPRPFGAFFEARGEKRVESLKFKKERKKLYTEDAESTEGTERGDGGIGRIENGKWKNGSLTTHYSRVAVHHSPLAIYDHFIVDSLYANRTTT